MPTIQMCIIAPRPVEKAFREPSAHRKGGLASVWGPKDASQRKPVITTQCPECLGGDGTSPFAAATLHEYLLISPLEADLLVHSPGLFRVQRLCRPPTRG